MFIDAAGNFSPADPDFTDQLIYYARYCLSDPRIIGLAYLVWSDPTNDLLYRPHVWEGAIPNMSEHLNRLRVLPDIALGVVDDWRDVLGSGLDTGDSSTPFAKAASAPGIREQTIRVLFEDGVVQTMDLEAYLRVVVPGEVPAHWPAEAVKAQTIAARGYAQYAIEHPRHAPEADVCTTTHCQYYDPSKIHPQSDEAIRQTRGIIALYRGRTANTVFSARSGGHTRNNEDVWQGTPIPYMRAVPWPHKGEKRGHGIG